MTFQLPPRGFVFWPVGNGDSTTIAVDAETFIQVDINHLEKSESDEDNAWSVVDELASRLPRRGGRPYLAAFALTHPDQDHCRGFEALLERVDIGELWFTPRVFREYHKDLCDDATAFKKEAERRVRATVSASGDPGSGNRVRIFGYSELLEEPEFSGFPSSRIVVPGTQFESVDYVDLTGAFRGFVHAPFKGDDSGERNATSLGLQVSLFDGQQALRALLLGDLKYPTIKRIFDVSQPDDLAWNVLLAPHHCSKSVMYWKDENGGDEVLKQHILDAMAAASQSPNRIVSSSNPVPSSNQPGDNPPHAKAKRRYETVTESFLCTMENPTPIVVTLEGGAIKTLATPATAKTASAAASEARGSDATPGAAVTYG